MIMVMNSDTELLLSPDEQHVSHPLSVLQASGHWQLSEEPIGLVDLQRDFMRHFSLLAKEHKKR